MKRLLSISLSLSLALALTLACPALAEGAEESAERIEEIAVEDVETPFGGETTPEDEETPLEEELPLDEEPPAEEELPADEEFPVEEGSPVEEEPPVAGESPAEEELPAEEEPPAEEESPVAGEELPAEEEPPAEADLPALAADELPNESPIVRVTVPDTGNVVVNPYRLKVQTGSGESYEQIVHEAQPLTNLSDVPVTVNVQTIGIIPVGSEAHFVPEPPSADAPGKDVFMYAEFRNRPDDWTGAYTGGYNQLIVTESGSSADAVMELEPQGEGYFRLFGAASTSPASMWTASDTVDVTVTFTFEAVVN